MLSILTDVQGAQWAVLSTASDLVYKVDVDSVSKDPQGYIEYQAQTIWTTPVQLPEAVAPVAVSLARYQMDCDKKLWRVLDTLYFDVKGASAGADSSPTKAWSEIGPDTVIDMMFKKVC